MRIFKRKACGLLISALALSGVFMVSGCTMPRGGPSYGDVTSDSQEGYESPVPLIKVNGRTGEILESLTVPQSFFKTFGNAGNATYRVAVGDSLDIYIWESAPALLFGTANLEGSDLTVKSEKLPTQVVEADGMINVPFAGRISVKGNTVREIENRILKALGSKANNPQVLVHVPSRTGETVTVLGDVKSAMTIPLSVKRERILDAVAQAGGVTESYNKVMLKLTRNNVTADVPLSRVIENSEENITLASGDVLVATLKPWTFMVMGAAGRSQEVPLEAVGANLAQALSRAGGLNDNQANPAGVFVFRFEERENWEKLSLALMGDNAGRSGINSGSGISGDAGKVPVVYQIDFGRPDSFFAAQTFRIRNGDIIYVAPASGYELSKFLRLIGSIVNPAMSWGNSIYNLTN